MSSICITEEALSLITSAESSVSASYLETDKVLLAVRGLRYLHLHKIPFGSSRGCTLWQWNTKWHPAELLPSDLGIPLCSTPSWQFSHCLCFGDMQTQDMLLLGVKNREIYLKFCHLAHRRVICFGQVFERKGGFS